MLGLEKKGDVLCRVCGDKVRDQQLFCHISILYSWDKLNHQGQGNQPLNVFLKPSGKLYGVPFCDGYCGFFLWFFSTMLLQIICMKR